MKVASLAEVKNHFSQFLELSKKGPIFVTRNGSITAVLEHITDEEMEDYLLERNIKFRGMLKAARKKKGGMSLEAYRKSRKA